MLSLYRRKWELLCGGIKENISWLVLWGVGEVVSPLQHWVSIFWGAMALTVGAQGLSPLCHVPRHALCLWVSEYPCCCHISEGEFHGRKAASFLCLHIACPGTLDPRPPPLAQAEHQSPYKHLFSQGPKGVASFIWVAEWRWYTGEPQLTLIILLQEWENILCEIKPWSFRVRALTLRP